MKRLWSDYLRDIYQAVNDACNFVDGVELSKFLENKEKYYAVIRAFEIIGEASNKIPVDISMKYTNIPWKEMTAMRNLLIHEYFGVNAKVVFDTAKKDLPLLKTQLEALITELKI